MAGLHSNEFDSFSSQMFIQNQLKSFDQQYGIIFRRLKRRIDLGSIDMVEILVKFLRFFSDRLRTRRNVFILILIFTLIFYLLTKWQPNRTTYRPIQYDECLQENLDQFMHDHEQMNAIFNHEPLQYGELVSLPFTGNGYIGLSLSSQSQISLISENRSTFLPIGFSPLIGISSSSYEDSRVVVLQTNKGLVRRIQCLKITDEHSAYVTHLLYAHRQRLSLIVQEIHMINPSEESIELTIEQKKSMTTTHEITELNRQDISFDIVKDQFEMITNEIHIEKQQTIVFVIITNQFLAKKQIKANSQDKLFILTVTKYSPPLTNKTLVQQWQQTLQTQAKAELAEALAMPPNRLLKEHTDIWSSIWQSGFSISRSLAPSVMNGDAINRTIYYVLSSTPSPIYDVHIEDKTRSVFNQSLFQIDHCYESHSTLVGSRLWRSPGDDLAVSQLSNLWKSTLAKKGCASLMRSGVNGVLQSMLLSIGGIRFRNHHLEMNLDPKELHRDMFFRSIHFGKEYYLNISISVAQDNRAVIDVAINSENSRAYACDAGCLDPPVQLSTKPTRFPVKMTSPSTAILYITEDVDYMHQLKDTLHVKEVEIAPPHAHDVLALHRHGHKLGGLPIIFWIALVFLIIIFHLFLLKIVLNEMGFFKHTQPTYSRPRAL